MAAVRLRLGSDGGRSDMSRTVSYAVAALPVLLSVLGIAAAPALADDADSCKDWKNSNSISACNRLIERNSRDAAAYTNRGLAYWAKQDYDHAITDYNESIRIEPSNAIAFSNRGLAYWAKHDYDRAITDYNEAIRINPKFAQAYTNRGLSYNDKGDYDRAIADHDRALRIDPKFIEAYNNRGKAYWGKGDYDRSIAEYDQTLRLDPKFLFAWVGRGLAYEKKADYAHAMADYEHALSLDPNYAFARQSRDRIAAVWQPPKGNAQTSAVQDVAVQQPPKPNLQSQTPAAGERRVALVIGNSGYASSFVPALPNPRRDAKLVADALRQAGFETVLLTDLDHDGMVKALQSFRAKADNADWALVYYAGHGIEINRVNYLLPVDAKLADSRDVKHETVSYEDIAETIGGARALRIIVLDACRTSPFKANMRQTVAMRGSLERGLAAPPEAEPGTLVVYAAKEGEAAVDGDGVNSPFAQAFVSRLKTPGREVQRMFDDVRDDVLAATGKRQQPYKYGSLPGSKDFYFVAK
jgi:tetratricopeptide (TPR) repeat protein